MADPAWRGDYLDLEGTGYATAAYWGEAPSIFLVSIPPAGELPGRPAGSARALDLGCGQGRNAAALAAKGYRVDAVDALAPAVDWVRRAAVPGVVATQADALDVLRGTPPGRYDVVLANHLVQHLADLAAVGRFVELATLALRPDGYLALSYFTEPLHLHPADVRESALVLGRGVVYPTFFQGPSFELVFFQFDVMADAHGEPHRHPLERLIVQRRS